MGSSSSSRGIEFGFEFEQAVAAAHFEVSHAVGDALRVEFAHDGHLLLAEGDHDDAVAFEGEAQLVLELFEFEIAEDFQFRLEAGHRVVEAAVDDSGIRLGDAEADVRPPFDQRRLHVVTGQLPGGGGSGNSGADDCDIIFHRIAFPFPGIGDVYFKVYQI